MEELLLASALAPEAELLPGRDLFLVAQYMIPTDAYLAAGCLAASGIPAVVADANHAQANLLIVPALGGVRVLVPANFIDEAKRVMEAFERGEFALPDDADVGVPGGA